ncbi:DMT family transporter [Halobacillus sp. B23F22_1]|uniref:DMT family transporter n=1 Tax=Halobacillus sp. B23F22_1 TaxID=3459514 RepID=UPI00373E2EC1
MYPYVLMILVVFMYAGNLLIGKAINDLPPLTITFFRLLIAFTVLLPIGYRSVINHKSLFLENKKPVLALSLSGIALFNTFIYASLQFTSSSNAAILESAIPAVTVIFSIYLLKEKINQIQSAGVLLSLFGSIWVIVDGRLFQITHLQWNIGDIIMVGAILSWALYSIFVKLYMFRFPPYGAVLVITGAGVIFLLPAVIVEWMILGIPAIFSREYVAGLLYLGIFPSFIALIFYNRAVELLSASKASIFLNLLPVVTMLGAGLWLGEKITRMHIIGASIVMIGVLLTTQGGRLRGKKKLTDQTAVLERKTQK